MTADARARTKPPSRRQLLRILAVGGAAGMAWKMGWFGAGSAPVGRTRILMGTWVHLTVLGNDREAAEAAADATLERMARLESILTRHRPDSELSRLVAAGKLDGASDALLDVLRLAERISRMGDGGFDITVQPLLDLYRDSSATGDLPSAPAIEHRLELVDHRRVRLAGRSVTLARPGMGLTLDGIGKGYIVDRGVEELSRRGFADVYVEAGGDLMAGGQKADGRPWRIGIRHPRSASALQARFDARNVAVATSGDYMQPFCADLSQHHIVDPRTGYSGPELASSTVLAGDAATADALATLTLVLGSQRGRDLLESLPGCEGYFVSKALEVTRTSGFNLA